MCTLVQRTAADPYMLARMIRKVEVFSNGFDASSRVFFSTSRRFQKDTSLVLQSTHTKKSFMHLLGCTSESFNLKLDFKVTFKTLGEHCLVLLAKH